MTKLRTLGQLRNRSVASLINAEMSLNPHRETQIDLKNSFVDTLFI